MMFAISLQFKSFVDQIKSSDSSITIVNEELDFVGSNDVELTMDKLEKEAVEVCIAYTFIYLYFKFVTDALTTL